MIDRPVIYAAPMVRALLDDRKSQTRRLLSHPLAKCQPGDRLWVRERCFASAATIGGMGLFWTFAEGLDLARNRSDELIEWTHGERFYCPSIHMPRHVSRLTLEVTEVRQQRLQDITEADAIAEGVPFGFSHHPIAEVHGKDLGRIFYPRCGGWGTHAALGEHLGVTEVDCAECDTAKKLFTNLWRSLYGEESWDSNPHVVALSFEVHHQNIDAIAKEAA